MSVENEDSYTGLAAVVLVTVTGMTHSELFVSEEKNCTRLLLETAVSQELFSLSTLLTHDKNLNLKHLLTLSNFCNK